MKKHVTLGWGQFCPQGHNLNKLVISPLGNVTNIMALGLVISESNFSLYKEIVSMIRKYQNQKILLKDSSHLELWHPL